LNFCGNQYSVTVGAVTALAELQSGPIRRAVSCVAGRVTEINVVMLIDCGPAAARACGHKGGVREITDVSKLCFFLMA
jgi:hypothetical protein